MFLTTDRCIPVTNTFRWFAVVLETRFAVTEPNIFDRSRPLHFKVKGVFFSSLHYKWEGYLKSENISHGINAALLIWHGEAYVWQNVHHGAQCDIHGNKIWSKLHKLPVQNISTPSTAYLTSSIGLTFSCRNGRHPKPVAGKRKIPLRQSYPQDIKWEEIRENTNIKWM